MTHIRTCVSRECLRRREHDREKSEKREHAEGQDIKTHEAAVPTPQRKKDATSIRNGECTEPGASRPAFLI